ncbi:hypothetical protein EOM81_10215 [bacterium]|nr:hypothetical protein [bacterium]
MSKVEAEDPSASSRRKRRPALTPEAREQQLVCLAIDLAEQQLLDGTASSQVITHYLKLGSEKDRIEREMLEKKKELLEAQTQALKAAKKIDELYADALSAMRSYAGNDDEF